MRLNFVCGDSKLIFTTTPICDTIQPIMNNPEIFDADSVGHTEAWKQENAKYRAWFSNQHPNERVIQLNGKTDILADIKAEWNAMEDAQIALGWSGLIPAIPLIALVVGVLYAILH